MFLIVFEIFCCITNFFLFLFIICCRFNITTNDVYRGISDTTNSALMVGRLIAGMREPTIKGNSCNMHAQELVVVHALGLKKRTLDKVVIDKFPEGLHLRNKVPNS
jgi:hypothetical protein